MEAKIKVLMFKAWNCKLPDSLQCLFNTKSVNRYQARKPSNFEVKFCKSKIKLSVNIIFLYIIDIRC